MSPLPKSWRHKEKRKLAPTCGLPTSRAPPPNGMEKTTGTRPWSHLFGTDKKRCLEIAIAPVEAAVSPKKEEEKIVTIKLSPQI